MIHHVKIIPYANRVFKENPPFKLTLNKKETLRYKETRYTIRIDDEENKRIWQFIESLRTQRLNKSVGIINIPSSWDKKEYAFYTLVRGSKIEIKGIFETIAKSYYPKLKVEFEY